MTPEQFCYWLQGRAELIVSPPTEAEWRSIVEYLGLVFTKVTSPAPGTPSLPLKYIESPSTDHWSPFKPTFIC